MKIAILSRAPRAYSTQRLTTAARERGHKVGLFRPITLWPFPTAALTEIAGRAPHVAMPTR